VYKTTRILRVSKKEFRTLYCDITICTCMSLPRPVVPRSSTPAISLAKRIQRVQWMQRVMMVFTRGPMSLSSTALCDNNININNNINNINNDINNKTSTIPGNSCVITSVRNRAENGARLIALWTERLIDHNRLF
jgi:hypothetical protein